MSYLLLSCTHGWGFEMGLGQDRELIPISSLPDGIQEKNFCSAYKAVVIMA